ncbi:MAG: FtsK/SpoIIIE domain-containing protein, partial [Nocardioides sp.]
GVRLGLAEGGEPFCPGPDARHLLVVGEPASGKTTLLRTLVAELTSSHRPTELQILALHPRRQLLGAVAEEFCLAPATTGQAGAEAMRELTQALQARLPGPDLTAAQLGARNWWQGPEVWVVVDDYELLEPALWSPLLGLLPHAADIGLHLAITRGASGVGRALFDPVLTSIRATGLVALLAGPADEGPIASGYRLRPVPPGRAVFVDRRGRAQVVQVAE